MRKYTKKLLVLLAAMIMLAGVLLASIESSSAITVSGSVVNYNKLAFTYLTETEGDKTLISWELWCVRTNSVSTVSKKEAPSVVKLNNVIVQNTNAYYDVRSGSKLLLYGKQYIPRTNGAAKTVPFYATVDLTGTVVNTTLKVSGSIPLPAYETGVTQTTANIDWIDNNDAENKRPETVTVTLYREGTVYKEEEVSTEDNQVTFEELPRAYGGKVYAYTVGGSQVEDYLVSDPAESEIVYKYALVPERGFRMGFSI